MALLGAAFLLPGCARYHRTGLDPDRAQQVEKEFLSRQPKLSRAVEHGILALNPDQVGEKEITTLLSLAPAPRIVNIHGGIFPVHRRMISFSKFLIGMGYPGISIANPGDGAYSFSCYDSSAQIAGVIGWYYERDGLRAILVGHSQGGMQVVKVLHKLAGRSDEGLPVWNPLTWRKEARVAITDPLSGQTRPVAGLQIAYATAVGAGGLTRFLPNQWDMWGKLRTIPDSADEFTGFQKGRDLLGGDFLGFGPANLYQPAGTGVVRNVSLPGRDRHGSVPDTEHLLQSQQIKDWINNYHPTNSASSVPRFDSKSTNILWAAEVWHGIKKHWVLELQRLIRARRALRHDD